MLGNTNMQTENNMDTRSGNYGTRKSVSVFWKHELDKGPDFAQE